MKVFALFLVALFLHYEQVKGGLPCVKTLKSEIILTLDVSSSISPEDFEKTKQFALAIVKRIGVDKDGNRMGVVSFADYAQKEIYCDQYFKIDGLSTALRKVHQYLHFTNIQYALKFSYEMLNERGCGERKGINQGIVLLTDGQTNRGDSVNAHFEEAKKIRENGVSIFAVGVGPLANIAHLRRITADDIQAVMADDFDDLLTDEIQQKVVSIVCPDKSNTTSAPTTITTTASTTSTTTNGDQTTVPTTTEMPTTTTTTTSTTSTTSTTTNEDQTTVATTTEIPTTTTTTTTTASTTSTTTNEDQTTLPTTTEIPTTTTTTTTTASTTSTTTNEDQTTLPTTTEIPTTTTTTTSTEALTTTTTPATTTTTDPITTTTKTLTTTDTPNTLTNKTPPATTEKPIHCNCTITEEMLPCLKWTTEEIMKNFEGSCVSEKLKESLTYLEYRLSKVTRWLNDFRDCKAILIYDMSMNGVGRILPIYDQCVVNIECKLSKWMEQLLEAKIRIDKELKIYGEGWLM